MVKKGPLKQYFEFKERLIENKDFLLQIASAKSAKSRCKLISQARGLSLNVLRDLFKNIADRNIEIEKSIFLHLERKKSVQDLVQILKKFQKHPTIYRSENKLRQFLVKYNNLLPYIIKTILKNG